MDNGWHVPSTFVRTGKCTYRDRCRFRHERFHMGKQKNIGAEGNDILAEFFAQYPTFDYDPTASSSLDFDRMCDFFG